MINLKKSNSPEILKRNRKKWTREYLQYRSGALANEAAAVRYRHADVKQQLISDCHGKCIYCESKILHISPGNIEHMRPKSRFPEQVCKWSNLGLVCDECNRRKGNKWHDPRSRSFRNPFVDGPDEHILFAGPMITHRLGSVRGEITWRELGLDRVELFKMRGERLAVLDQLRDRWFKEPDPALKELLKKQLLLEAEDDREYSAAVRAFFRLVGLL